MLEVIPPPLVYKLNLSKMWCMNVLCLCWTVRDTMRALQLYHRAHCVAGRNYQYISAVERMLVVTDQTLFHRSRWIVDYVIRSHSLALATQYLFVTRRNRKIIVTDRKGWRWRGKGCETCDRGGSLSYIDWCVVFSSQVARLELYIEIASVGADIGNGEEWGRERQRALRGRKRDRYPLSSFSPFPPPSSIPVGMKAERIGGMGKEGKDESGVKREGVVAAATNIPGMD